MTFSVGRRGRLLRSQLLTSFRTTRRENLLTWKTEGQKNTELPTVDLSPSILGKNLVDPIKGQNLVPSHGLFPAAAPGVIGIIWLGKKALEGINLPGLPHPPASQPRLT